MLRALYVGNRVAPLDTLLATPELEVAGVWAADARVEAHARARGLRVRPFTRRDRSVVSAELRAERYDLLLSSGCPILLPISTLPGRLHVNTHPSALPALRGAHPVNGALLHGCRRAGVTLHHMTDRFDDGPVIHQETFELTDDVDLGLLYRLLFDLEPVVLARGLERLRAKGWSDPGEPQRGEASSYARRPEDMAVDLAAMTTDEILRRVRAFGIATQGVAAVVDGRPCRVFAADRMVNPHVLARWADRPAGTLLLEYEGRRLVRTRDGVVRLLSWTAG